MHTSMIHPLHNLPIINPLPPSLPHSRASVSHHQRQQPPPSSRTGTASSNNPSSEADPNSCGGDTVTGLESQVLSAVTYAVIATEFQNGITQILNCVGFVCLEYFKADFVYRTLWLQDSSSEDITSILYDVFDYFEDVRKQGGRVFVHCCQGVSRSTSLVIAYLMWREGQSFDDAFQLVNAARGITDPNMGFACQLLQCQKMERDARGAVESFKSSAKVRPGERKVGSYDVDYEIFQKAIIGGFVPPFPSSEDEHETHLSARESSWSALRRKVSSSHMKEIVTVPKSSLPRVYSDSMLCIHSTKTSSPSLSSISSSSLSYISPDSVSSPSYISPWKEGEKRETNGSKGVRKGRKRQQKGRRRLPVLMVADGSVAVQ
ncbi:hypothetical protein Ahy_A01g000629 [Arachis hypogaea]|uniref:Protein-tyrosine-phosphatase n=1 Tax=Arachis hypogaea TaxID=3818 RepID=A0A445EL26_ARAHY|nr:hypothetical protein Ahy_A01g000629 [Arachis hypogaea]